MFFNLIVCLKLVYRLQRISQSKEMLEADVENAVAFFYPYSLAYFTNNLELIAIHSVHKECSAKNKK